MQELGGRVAVITGAASGFGREFARLGASQGMKLVLADVDREGLAALERELAGTPCITVLTDVSRAEDIANLAQRTMKEFGAAHLLFNNAGVGSGGLIWESSLADWQWVLGVNLWGVIHGVREFVPLMLAQDCECHIVNTASVAGLLSPPGMGVYNVSKHAVVTLSETLFHDLRLAGSKIGTSVLCPAFVPTGIHQSERNRPDELRNTEPLTASQRMARDATAKAVTSGRVTAAQVAELTFEAIRANRFYVLSHPKILDSVGLRLQDILALRNPSDPFTYKPGVAPRSGA
ncbi:MAG: SDR family oxidoreductase [Burkholderiaceae bacterium]|nr:SDR family oxidoreductase [Burkholderiaceae bacterium]